MVCVCLCVCFWWAIQVMVQWKTHVLDTNQFLKGSKTFSWRKVSVSCGFPIFPHFKKYPVVIQNTLRVDSQHQEAGELHCHDRALRYQLRRDPCFCWGVGFGAKHQQGNTPIWRPSHLGRPDENQASMRLGAEGLLGGRRIFTQWLDVFLGQIHPRG